MMKLPPEEILIQIFSYLHIKYLLTTIPQVCRLFHKLVKEQSVWKLKCIQDRITTVNLVETHDYLKLYLNYKYGSNLILNSCAKEDFKHWTISANGGHQFQVESRPVGSNPVPFDEKCQTPDDAVRNWVTSYGKCQKSQIIDLKNGAAGTILALIKRFQPKIIVSEWYSSRNDCGCKYHLEVNLLNKKKEVLDTYDYADVLVASREWKKVVHEFTDYSATSLKFIEFTHSGKDTQFWAGHYGAKFTHSTVYLQF